MKFTPILVATLAFALSAPALAADATQDKPTDKEQPAPTEKKICRTSTVTGSLVAKRRICKTQAEWNELAANTKKAMDDYINGASSAPQRSYTQGE